MPRRHPIPRLWLMTDERSDAALGAALARLPRDAGVVVRHHATPLAERRALLRAIARRHRGPVLGAGVLHGRDGRHNGRPRHGLYSRAVHDRRAAIAAVRAGADLIFVSPVFATRSHPGARPLGVVGLARIIRGLAVPAIALGGMDARRFRALRRIGLHGWAGIDAWSAPKRQKRKAVPT